MQTECILAALPSRKRLHEIFDCIYTHNCDTHHCVMI